MQAIVVRQHGGVEGLAVETVSDPIAGAGEVLVAVRACGVNHLDLWVRRGVPGHRFPLPLIPGSDVAGVVREVGAGVQHVRAGDAVVVAPGVSCGVCAACAAGRDQACRAYGILGEHRHGGYAELLAVPAANVIQKPPDLGFEEAAALGVATLTAWHMLVARAQIRPGEIVLVQAAGSGVGTAAVQIAKLWGATVVATAGSAAKRERALRLGADHVIDTASADFVRTVKALTGGAGADVVVEHVGTATWEASLRALGREGRLVTCGATTGAEVAINLRHLFYKSQSLLGSTMGSRGEFFEVLAHAAQRRLRPVVDRVLPLTAAGEAHRSLEAREIFGKIVLVP